MTHDRTSVSDRDSSGIERYRALLRVAEAIASHSDLSALVQDLARLLPLVVPVNFVGLSLYDSQRGVMRLQVLRANVPAEIIGGHESDPQDTPAGLVWETQQPLLLNDLPTERRWPKVIELMCEDGVRSCCLVPLTSPTQRLGSLEFSSLEQSAYSTSDVELMQQVGRQVAVAVENVLNREAAAASQRDVERQRDRFSLLLRMTNSMASTLDLRQVFKAVSLCLRELVPQEYASLILCDGQTQRVRLHALDFPDNEGALTEGALSDVAGSLAGLAFERRRPAVANTLADLKAFSHAVPQLLVRKGFRSMCSLPLLSRDRVIGCLNLASRQEQAFGQSGEADTATAVADRLAQPEGRERRAGRRAEAGRRAGQPGRPAGVPAPGQPPGPGSGAALGGPQPGRRGLRPAHAHGLARRRRLRRRRSGLEGERGRPELPGQRWAGDAPGRDRPGRPGARSAGLAG